SKVVVDHDRVSIFDTTDELRFLHGIESEHISDGAEHIPFEIEWFYDKVCDNNFPTVVCHGVRS
ncbi:MAG: hypothetical protein ACK55I_32125, partial [bacterium]